MDATGIARRLEKMGDPEAVAGMSRAGIAPGKAYGVKIPVLRTLAREIGRDHGLALELWSIDNRETRILASMIDEPKKLTEAQMEAWAGEFWDWEVCDQCCANLFEKSPLAWTTAVKWAGRPEEFVKRAGFVLMARLAVSDKKAPDSAFEPFFPLIIREAADKRNFVKKAVNWALRQIGKRNPALNQKAVDAARRIQELDSRAARWVAADALRELGSRAVQARLKSRERKQ
ncbi:MAG: DNA alkylation repair protein [Thermodesulfobacteriota bacterium]